MIWKYLLLWFPMLVLAVINGAARDMLYRDSLGELRAHQLSTVTLLLLFSVYVWVVIRRWPPASERQAWLVGLLWLLLTLAFEFGFGRFGGRSWTSLLQEYNVAAGKVWVFIPIWLAVAPYLFYRLQR